MISPINTIIESDALRGLRKLPADFVDMILTSPPYFGMRDYGIKGQIGQEATPKQYIDKLIKVFTESKRVLVNQGSLWVNMGDAYASIVEISGRKASDIGLNRKSLIGIPFMFATAMIQKGWILRNTIVWQKPNAMPESAKDRFTNDFEYLFFFTKSTNYYFRQQLEPYHSDEYDIKRMQKGRKKKMSKWDETINRSKLSAADVFVGGNEKGRIKRTVWNIPTQSFKEAHFAVFPEELIKMPILSSCPIKGLVLDPFMGAGTTAVVANKFFRNYLGFELNPDFIKIANKRINQ